MCLQGQRYLERIVHQEEAYVEIRDSLRNARKKKDGKDAVLFTSTASVPKGSGTLNSTKKLPGTPGHIMGSAAKSKAHALDVSLTDVSIQFLNQQLQENCAATSTVDRLANCENHDRNSYDSTGTEFTSMTEVKERASTATVIRSHRL